MVDKTILVVGTYDTKNDELEYMVERITAMGGSALTMDVSVLGDPQNPTDISKHAVAEAANSSIQSVIDSGNENTAMQIMTNGACALTIKLFNENKFDGVVILGGTMGTDLALDVCRVLPIGVPKYVVSTVSFSPLIPPERLASDIQMILWAGGLYGLNSLCKSSLSQAAGAVLGAARAVQKPDGKTPIIGMTALGTSCLRYQKILKPELEKRGFEVAVFHATGMGGMAFEHIAAEGGFACVMDFALQEFSNLIFGSVVSAGNGRLLGASLGNTPQLVAPGCLDLIDFAGWQEIPAQFQERPFHEHNRLIKSSSLNGKERRLTAQKMAERLSKSKAPVHVLMPNQGIEEWDREGGDAYDPDAFGEFLDEMRKVFKQPIIYDELNCHINDEAFAHRVLEVFDKWLTDGTVQTG
jgi:uncharacterized protein (UPF0261 family)